MARPSHLRRVTDSQSTAAPRSQPKLGSDGALMRAEITSVNGAGCTLRLTEASETVAARIGWIAGYSPTAGDRVLVARDGDEHVVVTALTAACRPAIVTPDGARAEVVGGAIEFRDGQGRLLVRYESGALEVAPASGDLRLRAPAGRVHIEAATDVNIAASRDVAINGVRSAQVSVTSSRTPDLPSRLHLDHDGAKITGRAVEMRAQLAKTLAAKWDLVATDVRTNAKTIETHARKLETTAEKVTTRAKEMVEEVAGLLETRAGRMRSLVKGAFSLRTKTVHMKSEEDTSIDGRRVLLG